MSESWNFQKLCNCFVWRAEDKNPKKNPFLHLTKNNNKSSTYHTWKPPIRWNIKIIITKEENSTYHGVLWREVVNEIEWTNSLLVICWKSIPCSFFFKRLLASSVVEETTPMSTRSSTHFQHMIFTMCNCPFLFLVSIFKFIRPYL
jgi:hypothetical protein